jgi:hypothetical protein
MLLLASCASGRIPRVGEAPPMARDDASEHSYQEILNRFTDHKGIYDGLDTRLFVAATWQSPRFIEARVRRLGEFQEQPESEVNRRVLEEREKFKGRTEFFFGIHANDPKFDDFDRKNTIWRIALVVGDKEIVPTEIKRVGRSTMDMRATYPYMDVFWVAYAVRFDGVMEPNQTAKLKVASTLGQAELNFQTE